MRRFEKSDFDVELVIALLGVAMVCGVVLLRVLPGGFLPTAPCTFHRVTGLPCLTCGGTRAARALGHLRVLEALRWNPLVAVWLVAAVPHALWVFVSRWLGLRRPRLVPESKRERWALWSGLLVLIAGNWLYLCLSGV